MNAMFKLANYPSRFMGNLPVWTLRSWSNKCTQNEIQSLSNVYVDVNAPVTSWIHLTCFLSQLPCAVAAQEGQRPSVPMLVRKHGGKNTRILDDMHICFPLWLWTLKMLGLYLDTLTIGHTSCNMISMLNKLTLQKELQTFVTNNVF